jgi:hypothetical protein
LNIGRQGWRKTDLASSLVANTRAIYRRTVFA